MEQGHVSNHVGCSAYRIEQRELLRPSRYRRKGIDPELSTCH